MERERSEWPKPTLRTVDDFLALPGATAVVGTDDGRVTLHVLPGFVDAYRGYFAADGPGRERLLINVVVSVVERLKPPPLGPVPYLPQHSHPHQITCDAGCPVFDWERHVLRHGSPYG